MKKMSKQVDQSLFDQAPEEQAPTPATVSLILRAAGLCQRCQHLVTPHFVSHVLGAADRVPMIHLWHPHAELMLTDLGALAECLGVTCVISVLTGHSHASVLATKQSQTQT